MSLPSEEFGAGVPSSPAASGTTAQTKPDDRFTGLVESLMRSHERNADPPPQATPAAQDAHEDPISQTPERLIDPEVMAQAVALGIPPDKLFAQDPDQIPAFVQAVADYASQQQAARQAAPVQYPQFDSQARLKQLVEVDKWDEQLARVVVENERRSHELQIQVARLTNHLTAVQSQAQAAAAAQAGVMWDQQIQAGLAALPPQLATLADNPSTLSRVQAKSRELAHMLVASGQPVPDNKTLASQAAMLTYGTELLTGGRPSFSEAVTPRPQAAAADAGSSGRTAAVSFIDNFLRAKTVGSR